MDYKEALKRIKALDASDAADLVSAIEGEVDSLKTKNFEVIGEKRTATQKAQAMQSALEAIGKAVGIEGDLDAILENAQAKVSGLASETQQLRTDKAALETRASEAEGKVKQSERRTKLSEIASKAGAETAVLERLLGDRIDELSIADDGVKLGDKPLKEAIAADEALKPFAPALFPGDSSSPNPKDRPRLPGGSPNGSADKGISPLDSYLERNRSGAKALASKD